MRHLQTSWERLLEPREVYGIPMSNLIIVLTICLSVFRNAFFRLVRPFSARITCNRGKAAMKDNEFRTKHEHVTRKGQKYMYHLLWFSIMVPWEIRQGLNAPWFDFLYRYSNIEAALRAHGYGMQFVNDSDGNSVCIAHDPRDEPWFQEFHLFMILQMAWYVHNFIEETLWDRLRGDFAMMVAHHIITIALILFSLQLGFEHGGMFVILVMDLMDLFLYSFKISHLITCTVDGKARSAWHVTQQKVLSSGILCSWIVLRLYCFISIVVAGHIVFMGSSASDNVFMRHPEYVTLPKGLMTYPFLASFIYVLLVLLALLQIIWMFMIFRVCYRLMRSGLFDDDVFQTYSQPETKPLAEDGSSVVHSGKQE